MRCHNNPVRYNDPTGHRMDDGCNTDGCDVGTLETYTLAGIETVSPSYFGFKINYRPPLLVAAWTALGAHTSAGRAKLYPEEVEKLGIDPQTPEGAFLGMQKRIDDRMKACTGCSDTDKFIVAALGSDYNFGFGHIGQATKKLYAAEPGGPNTINWEHYLREGSGNLRKKFGDLLSSFTSNVLDLQSQGYYVPNGVDFDYILNTLLPTIP
jgi:hypothetical protein